MAHFDPYFEPLKAFVQNWWHHLYFEYKYEAYEQWNIHANTLRIFKKPLAGSSSAQSEQTKAEETRREEYLRSTLRNEASSTSHGIGRPL